MPYSPDKKKRTIYVTDSVWNAFKNECDRNKCQINATIVTLLLETIDGNIKLLPPRKPGLRFKLDPHYLHPEL